MNLHGMVKYTLRIAAVLAFSALLGGVMPVVSAQAYDSDAALERDGALCTHQVARSERKYGIPQRLLGAIAATETGRTHRGLGIKVPWPWAINVEGRPFFFHTKREAVQMVEKFQAEGVRSIDVGCMQINLYHHPDAFANLSQAFEPSFNVDYAARFLRGHYDETGVWKTAVGRYHSRTPGHAARYVGLVYGQWYGLADKKHDTRRSKYKSYIRMENTGEQKDLSSRQGYVVTAKPRTATPQTQQVSSTARVVRPSTREASKGHMDISIIRPAASAAKIEATPTTDVAASSNPIVMDAKEASKDFTTPKHLSISAREKREQEDSRFIRFVD